MAEYTDVTTFEGQPVTLVGQEVKVGQQAPDATLHKGLRETVRVSEARGSVLVLTTAPSVDTRVCATQLRTFNKAASELPGVKVWFVTRDLPFALGRFCGAEGIRSVTAVSDFKEREFGERYGVSIKELGLLTRATFVVDRGGKVVFREIVPENATEPNYDAALLAVKAAL
jgi:thiol peroxidase